MIPTPDTVQVIRAGELDDWGRPTNPEVKEYKCRIDYTTEKVQTDNGEEKVSKATILIKGVAQVSLVDTIKWTDPYGTHENTPLSVNPIKDFSGKILFTRVVV